MRAQIIHTDYSISIQRYDRPHHGGKTYRKVSKASHGRLVTLMRKLNAYHLLTAWASIYRLF